LVSLGQRQHAGYVGLRGHSPYADQAGGGFHATGADVLAVAGELQQVVHLGLGNEGAPALVTVDPLLGLETVQRLAHRPPRHAEALAELALRRHTRTCWQLADERDERVANGLMFG